MLISLSDKLFSKDLLKRKKGMDNMKKIISLGDIEKLRQFDSPTISNAIEFFKVRDNTIGFSSWELKCLIHQMKPMVGYAVTVTVDTTSAGPIPDRFDKFRDLLDIMDKYTKPIILCLKYLGPDRQRSCIAGEIFSAIARKLGVLGIITDCGIRDLKNIKKTVPDFYVFSPGKVVSHGLSNFLELNTIISICGITVKPGDLLHGDESGVVNVPIDLIDIKKLIKKANDIRKEENKILEYIKSKSMRISGIKEKLIGSC